MAKNQVGLQVTVKGFIVTGKDLLKQHEATSAFMQGAQTGDYSNLLQMIVIDEVQAVPRTRRSPEKREPEPAPILEYIDTQTKWTEDN